MEESILTSVKKLLGIPATITAFDLDIMIHINTAFSSVCLLGVGPTTPFMITGETEKWTDFSAEATNLVKSYVYLFVKLVFDPPQTSFVTAAMERQIKKLEWTMNVIEDQEEVL